MTALRFEGTTIDDDITDSHYLRLIHQLAIIGELAPSEEAAGGLTVVANGNRFVTHQSSGPEREKILPTWYAGKTAVASNL